MKSCLLSLSLALLLLLLQIKLCEWKSNEIFLSFHLIWNIIHVSWAGRSSSETHGTRGKWVNKERPKGKLMASNCTIRTMHYSYDFLLSLHIVLCVNLVQFCFVLFTWEDTTHSRPPSHRQIYPRNYFHFSSLLSEPHRKPCKLYYDVSK